MNAICTATDEELVNELYVIVTVTYDNSYISKIFYCVLKRDCYKYLILGTLNTERKKKSIVIV